VVLEFGAAERVRRLRVYPDGQKGLSDVGHMTRDQ
jgi:hypothetical protein